MLTPLSKEAVEARFSGHRMKTKSPSRQYTNQLHSLYRTQFFPQFRVDVETGILRDHLGLKFPTLPYVGSCYGIGRRVLFVGMDIGSDEKHGGIQSFEERREAIEAKALANHNAHIAGTYVAALHFLKNECSEWRDSWNALGRNLTCQQLLKLGNDLARSNPLAYVALTNYFKFVRPERKRRSGGENRKYVDKGLERKFFVKEVNVLAPQVIVFQGAQFNKQRQYRKLAEELSPESEVYLGPHPSARNDTRRVNKLITRILDARHPA